MSKLLVLMVTLASAVGAAWWFAQPARRGDRGGPVVEVAETEREGGLVPPPDQRAPARTGRAPSGETLQPPLASTPVDLPSDRDGFTAAEQWALAMTEARDPQFGSNPFVQALRRDPVRGAESLLSALELEATDADAAARAVAMLRDPAHLERLSRVLESGELLSVPSLIAEGLAAWDDPRAEARLRSHALDPGLEPFRRQAACDALARDADADQAAALLEHYWSQPAAGRSVLLGSIAALGTVPVARGPDAQARVDAATRRRLAAPLLADALGSGEPRVWGVAVDLLVNEPSLASEALARGLESLGARLSDPIEVRRVERALEEVRGAL